VIQGAPPLTTTLTIEDDETAAASLNVTLASNNQSLIPDANLSLSGSGTERTLTVTPVPMQTGTATITLTVDDGVNAPVTTTFTVTVIPPEMLYIPLLVHVPAKHPTYLWYHAAWKPDDPRTEDTRWRDGIRKPFS